MPSAARSSALIEKEKTMTQTELINAIIGANAPLSIAEIVKIELETWRSSPKRVAMLDGQRYYEAQNDILNRRRMAIGKNGQLTEVHNVANNRIAHAFLQELVDQKTQYLLGKAFSIKSDDDSFVQAIYSVLGDAETLRHTLKRAAKDAINKGIAWLHVYYDTAGAFTIKRMEPEEMVPLWADNEHTVLNGMIRVYPVEVWEARTRKIIHKVELWTDDGVQRWVEKDGVLTEDPDLRSGAHMTTADGKPFNWQKLPFVAFKYNDEELPLLHKVKTLVDEYDRTVSDDANMLEDQPNKVFVIKNFDGSDLGEFRRNMSIYRAVKVLSDGPGGGGVDTLDTTPDVTASNQHLERIRRDIYAFGRGVDTRNERLTGATSGLALKFEYAQLDLDCNSLETGLQVAFQQLLWFVKAHLANTGKGSFENATAQIVCNRDIIINEESAIVMCANSMGMISEETIVANHPWVEDPTAEMERLKAQRRTEVQRYGGDYGDGDDV
jgi:SPP1 family phage portal protein